MRIGALSAAGGALLLGLAFALWQGGWLLAPWRAKTAKLQTADGAFEIALAARTVTLRTDGHTVWQTEKGWRVQDFLVGDLDHDGGSELLLLLWKRGSYGSARPFWVQHDDFSYSQHIFIYEEKEGTWKPQWMSSALKPRVRAWAFLADGSLSIETAQGEATVWGWRSWGLERRDRPPALL